MNRSLVTFIGAFLLCGLGAATARAEKPENCASGIWQVALHTTPSTASEALATLTALRNNPHLSEEVATDTITMMLQKFRHSMPRPLLRSTRSLPMESMESPPNACRRFTAIAAEASEDRNRSIMSTESYQPSFYDLYAAYLIEPRVRLQHDRIFRIARNEPAFQSVIDMGCGQGQEFYHYFRPRQYIGVDLNVSNSVEFNKRLIHANYREPTSLISVAKEISIGAVVSLFSSEITRPVHENYELYTQLFQKTAITAMLVSGFYYSDRRHLNPVHEEGDVLSYQTLEQPEDVISPLFQETRIVLPVPSKLFGESVYEVWKFLERR